MDNNQPRVALVYDRVNSWGGAERVLIALHKLFPNAPLYTSVYDREGAPWADGWKIKTSWLQKIPWFRKRHRYLGWLMPAVFESFNFSDFDIVVSVSSEAAKGVITQPDQLHLCYLLTPTRYLWSHQPEYLQQIPTLFRKSARKVVEILQKWDRVLASRPDFLIPISKLVKKRAQKYYLRPIEEPLYPAILNLPLAKKPQLRINDDYFFCWGRQVAYKQFDLIIRAACELHFPLIIAGTGPQSAKLKQLASELDPMSKNIYFVDQVTDSEIAWYLQHAQAAVIPQEEDFGLTIMESISQGCPVIVNGRSGAAELLRPDRDVVFISSASVDELVQAMRKAVSLPWDNLDIRQQARQYAEVVWQEAMMEKIMTLWNQQQKAMKGKHEQHS